MKSGRIQGTFPGIFLWWGCIILLLVNPANGFSIQGISDVPVNNVTVGDISIGYREFGSGEPLIMIMGYGGAMDLWDPVVLKNLSEEYRVIVFDNRGVGYSSDSHKEYTIPQFAHDTVGLMDALNISQAHILGWSMGADIALELAADYPEHVKKLILYAASPGGENVIPADPEINEKLSNISGTSQQRGERLLSLIFPSVWMNNHKDPRVYFPSATEPVNTSAISGQLHAILTWKGVYYRLENISSPTLLIYGTEDQVVPPENSDSIAARLQTRQVVPIQGGGHGVMYQFPEKFAKIVLYFLKR